MPVELIPEVVPEPATSPTVMLPLVFTAKPLAAELPASAPPMLLVSEPSATPVWALSARLPAEKAAVCTMSAPLRTS